MSTTTDRGSQVDQVRVATAALAEAAAAAGYAPSVHNTQPWRWLLRPGRLELHAERSRQLTVTDPEGRLLLISCGAALHHARVALAAEGWRVRLDRLPTPDDPDTLAFLSEPERIPVGADAIRLFQTVRVRHTDRRPVTDAPVEPAALAALARVVADNGAQLHVLRPDQVIELAAAAARAQASEMTDPRWRAELAYWTGTGRPAGVGVPDDAIPDRLPQTTVPGRDFGRPGTLLITAAHDAAATYAILYGDQDDPGAWLRAGEAMSAGWLEATERGLSVLPLSAAVEVAGTRAALRALLAGLGHPHLVLRLGVADPEHRGPGHTPRLPADQTIERVGTAMPSGTASEI